MKLTEMRGPRYRVGLLEDERKKRWNDDWIWGITKLSIVHFGMKWKIYNSANTSIQSRVLLLRNGVIASVFTNADNTTVSALEYPQYYVRSDLLLIRSRAGSELPTGREWVWRERKSLGRASRSPLHSWRPRWWCAVRSRPHSRHGTGRRTWCQHGDCRRRTDRNPLEMRHYEGLFGRKKAQKSY